MPPADAPRRYRFAGYRLDTRTRELRGRDGAPVALTSKAFDVLILLIEARDRVVRRDELLGTVWAGRVVEENTLTQAVAALRRALGEGPADHRFIVTVPGRGYRFVADVQEASPEVSPVPQVAAGSLGPVGATLLLALLFVGAIAATWLMHAA